MERKAVAFTLILAFMTSTMAGVINWAKANPWMGTDWVEPKSATKPPILTVKAPEENSVHHSSNVTLSFNARLGESYSASYMRLMKVYYKTDWEQNETYVYKNEAVSIPYEPNAITYFAYTINLTGVPEGKRYITIHAVEWGAYIDDSFVHMFSINGSSSVSFTIDASPSVSALSLVNTTYDSSDVPLIFTVNEPVSQMSYSLDGKENVTVSGNTTVTGLANGDHNITVYAKDETGNTGISETVYFTVKAPFPAAMVIAPLASVVVVGGVLAFYFRKRNGSKR